ncbi:MAG: response regulator [candidate division Zixibacteria bacterium]|nr:response regulator [candidate division Zixibacteria bacterium]
MNPTNLTDSAAGTTVLVVENNEEVRNLVRNVVATLGWRPIVAKSVEEALAALASESIDGIIADWELDDGNGEAILRKASEGRFRPIPSVVISSYASMALREQAKAAGALDLLEKPFRMEQLTSLLSRELPVAVAARG